MRFFENSKLFSLNRLQYINLRWIAIIGQLLTINLVKFVFDFEFDYVASNLIIYFGALSNLFLIYFYKKNQITDRSSFIFLLIDIVQLSLLLYLRPVLFWSLHKKYSLILVLLFFQQNNLENLTFLLFL